MTKGSAYRVQHAPETGLTYCQQCELGGHTPVVPPTESHEGQGRMPSPGPQRTCGLVVQTPMNTRAHCGRYRAGAVFHSQGENCIVPPESEVQLLAEFSSPVPWNRLSQGG